MHTRRRGGGVVKKWVGNRVMGEHNYNMLYTCVKLSKLKQLNVSWKIWSCQALREAGRAGRSRPALAVGILLFGHLCVGSLCSSSSAPGAPCPSLRLLLWTRNNLPVPSSLSLTLPALAGSHENPTSTCSLSASKALTGRGYRMHAAAFVVGCWEGKLDFLYRDLLTSSKQQTVASGAQRLSFLNQTPAFIIQMFLRRERQQKLLQSRAIGCS